MESEFPGNIHIVTYIPTMFLEIQCSGLRGVALTKKTGLID